MEYVINRVFEHYEVYSGYGEFLFSADSYNEAVALLEELSAA